MGKTTFRSNSLSFHIKKITTENIQVYIDFDLICRIQIFYGNYQGFFHGGEGGFLHRIRLYNGDRIIKITGRAGIGPGADIDQLTFYTRE